MYGTEVLRKAFGGGVLLVREAGGARGRLVDMQISIWG